MGHLRVSALSVALEGRVDSFDARFDSLERRFDTVDHRFDAVDRRFERVEQRIDSLDAKVDRFRTEFAGAVTALDTKMSSQYRWLLGTQLTVFVTVIGVLAGALYT
jgi:glutathione S-transferase